MRPFEELVAARWFARRPCFWGGLLAVAAIFVTDQFAIPGPAWALLAVAGCLTLPTRFRIAGALTAVAALFGTLTAHALSPPRAPDLPENAPVALRGEVVAVLPASGERQRFLLAARERRVRGHWEPDATRYGAVMSGPVAAGDIAEVNGRIEYPLPPTNPAGYDARHAWLRRGVRCVVQVRPAGYRLLGHGRRSAWQRLAAGLRSRIVELNRATLSPAAAYVANSFLVGDLETPDPDMATEVQSAFRNSGTLHLLVVSGTQVSLVLWGFLWLGSRWRRGRYLAWLLGLGTLALFHAVTDGDASISRAAVVGGLIVGALVCQRRVDGENCLGAAALVLLALNPFTLWDVGAQLSFIAVWSLVRVTPSLELALGPPEADPQKRAYSRAHTLWLGASRLVASCVAAHLATAPVLAYHFQSAAWSGVLANLTVALLATILTFVALAHVALAQLGVPLLAGAAEQTARALYECAKLFATPPLGTAAVYPPPSWLLPICFGLLVLAGQQVRNRRWVIGTLATLAAVLFLSERTPALPPKSPTVRAVDIGQGDALLLQGTDGSNILVDAGPPAAGATLARTLRALRVASLDALLVSHAHLDHVGGFPQLAETYPPRLLIHEEGIADSEGWQSVRATASHAGVRLVPAAAGDRFRIRGTTLTLLGPLPGSPRGSENEESLVALWESAGARVLLTGDSGINSEQQLLAWGADLHADLLKVGHHGSNGSTSPELLEAVHPQLAVLSCGRHNRFGHPGLDTLERLKRSEIPVLRTDLSGMITVQMERGRLKASSYLQPSRTSPDDATAGGVTTSRAPRF